MAYYIGCDCSYGQILVRPSRCIACAQLPGDSGIGGVYTAQAEQQRIWKTVRVPSSIYTMNLASLTVPNGPANEPRAQYNFVNWNQLSDRAVPSIQRACVPTRGNSTRSSITAARPGACAPCGKGVDIKHDSYARYLAKKKAGHLKTNTGNPCLFGCKPVQGNKSYPVGVIPKCQCL